MNLSSALKLKSTTSVSKAAAIFHKNNTDAAIVMSGKKYSGVLYARDLVNKRLDDPHKVTIKRFVTPLTPVEEVQENLLLNSMILNDYKSIPIKQGKTYSFITNSDMLSLFSNNPVFLSKRAGEVMKYPYCVNNQESVTTALSLFSEMNIERIPIVDENDRIQGLLNTKQLLQTISKQSRQQRGAIDGERAHLLDIDATSLAGDDFIKVSEKTTLKKVILSLLKENNDTALIEENKRITGIITPKPLLRLIGQEIEGVTINISGLNVIESKQRKQVEHAIQSTLKKLSKYIAIDFLALHVEHYKSTGRKHKYSLRARLITEHGFFFAQRHGWSLFTVLNSLLAALKTEVEKKYTKKRSVKRRR